MQDQLQNSKKSFNNTHQLKNPFHSIEESIEFSENLLRSRSSQHSNLNKNPKPKKSSIHSHFQPPKKSQNSSLFSMAHSNNSLYQSDRIKNQSKKNNMQNSLYQQVNTVQIQEKKSYFSGTSSQDQLPSATSLKYYTQKTPRNNAQNFNKYSNNNSNNKNNYNNNQQKISEINFKSLSPIKQVPEYNTNTSSNFLSQSQINKQITKHPQFNIQDNFTKQKTLKQENQKINFNIEDHPKFESPKKLKSSQQNFHSINSQKQYQNTSLTPSNIQNKKIDIFKQSANHFYRNQSQQRLKSHLNGNLNIENQLESTKRSIRNSQKFHNDSGLNFQKLIMSKTNTSFVNNIQGSNNPQQDNFIYVTKESLNDVMNMNKKQKNNEQKFISFNEIVATRKQHLEQLQKTSKNQSKINTERSAQNTFQSINNNNPFYKKTHISHQDLNHSNISDFNDHMDLLKYDDEKFQYQLYNNMKQKEYVQKKFQTQQKYTLNKILKDFVKKKQDTQSIQKHVKLKPHQIPQLKIPEHLLQQQQDKKKKSTHDILISVSSNPKSNNNRLSTLQTQKQQQNQNQQQSQSRRTEREELKPVEAHNSLVFNQWQWRPQGRIGATLSYIQNKLYLIGGRANDFIEDVSCMEIDYFHHRDMLWKKLEIQNHQQKNQQPQQIQLQQNKKKSGKFQKNKSPDNLEVSKQPQQRKKSSVQFMNSSNSSITSKSDSDKFQGRIGHTACVFNDKIIVFGGESHFNVRNKTKTCLNDVFIFDTKHYTWKYKLCKGDYIEGRSNHTSCILGQSMVVFGGTNGIDKIPQDLMILDLNDYLWKQYGGQGDYKDIFAKTGGLTQHTCLPIYEDPSGHKLHYSKPLKKVSINIREQGIYFFGGKYENNKINKHLYILKTEIFPLQWKILETYGQQPPKRYNHVMHHLPTQNKLLISGGKSDKNDIVYLNDTFVLDLQNLIWQEVQFTPQSVSIGRALSSSACNGNSQLYIFGGMTLEKYCGSELNIVELNQNKYKIIIQYEKGMDTEGKYEEYQHEFLKQQNAKVRSFMPVPQH